MLRDWGNWPLPFYEKYNMDRVFVLYYLDTIQRLSITRCFIMMKNGIREGDNDRKDYDFKFF